MRKFVATLISWDQRAVQDLVAQRNKTLNRCMTVITFLGGWLWLIVTWILLLNGPKQLLAHLLFAMGLQVASYLAIKNLCSRRRPYELLKEVPCIVAPYDRYSFPSGHAAAAFVLLGTVGVFYSLLFLPLLFLALLICFSRIYVGVHYPSDVLAGALLGIACAGIATWIFPG